MTIGDAIKCLTVWWIALAIVILNDRTKKSKELRRLSIEERKRLENQIQLTRESIAQNRWPNWSELRHDPKLALKLPFILAIYGALFLFIWPACLIHRAKITPSPRF